MSAMRESHTGALTQAMLDAAFPRSAADPTALSAQVARLEERAGDLETLCGEVLATLHCNYQRGHLSYRADCGKDGAVTNELLGRMIDEWRARLGRLRS